ncbi:MAG: NUDIX domain-containing protein [Candidatus Riflebacteria bacterium]|nr:NUDIX domain-containing protein [Candidatus Riflebacteria bacterium]
MITKEIAGSNLRSPIEVVAGVVVFQKKVLVAKRKGGYLHDLWEFPGGKIEDGETFFGAILRELKEELNLLVEPLEKILVLQHEYPEKEVRLHFIKCKTTEQALSQIPGKLIENEDVKWIDPVSFPRIEFCPADQIAMTRINWDNLFLT